VYLLATRSTDLFDGPQNKTCFRGFPSLLSSSLILSKR